MKGCDPMITRVLYGLMIIFWLIVAFESLTKKKIVTENTQLVLSLISIVIIFYLQIIS